MRKKLFVFTSFVGMVLCVSMLSQAQTEGPAKVGTSTSASSATPVINASTTPIELARAAFMAQGGEKFRSLKSVVLIGTVNLYPPNSTNFISGSFVIATSGTRSHIEVNAAPLVFKQIFDGQNSYSSLPNVPPFPPPTKFGLPVLAQFDQPGYTVTALPDVKKERGFRITDSDGNATNFYIEPATGRVLSFMSQFNGITFKTENKKMKELDGVLVSYSFSQRLEMTQGAGFAEYTVKDVKLNQAIGDDVFTIPN